MNWYLDKIQLTLTYLFVDNISLKKLLSYLDKTR